MTFILGQSRLSYDHLGDWVNLEAEGIEQTPAAIVGDSCDLGECSLGTFSLCEDMQAVEIQVEVR